MLALGQRNLSDKAIRDRSAQQTVPQWNNSGTKVTRDCPRGSSF